MNSRHDEFDAVVQKLHSETARIDWHSLQRFFAQGAVLWVDPDCDLVKTASLFAIDDAVALEPLLTELKVRQPSNDQARAWYQENAELWSVVVAPYVLVQELNE